MRILRSNRLVLEPLTEAHAPELFRVLVDPIIYTFLHERPPFTEEELRARYRFLEKRLSPDGVNEWLSWVVRDSGGDLIGHVQAEIQERKSAVLGVVLAPSAWRQGFAREALVAVMDELGNNPAVREFVAVLSSRNVACLKLFEALGFREQDRVPTDLLAVKNGDRIWAAPATRRLRTV